MTMYFGANPAFRGLQAGASKTIQVNKSATLALEVEDLRSQVDRLSMITEALWMLLQRQGNYTEEQLGKLVEEIDLRDGVLDGKSSTLPQQCPECQRTVSARTGNCIYCGVRPDSSQVF